MSDQTADLNWERVNVWTSTLYTIVHSLRIAKEQEFGDLSELPKSLDEASKWTPQEWSFSSAMEDQVMGKRPIAFRRDPNKYFDSIVSQTIRMLIQDLTVIFDEMMGDILVQRNESAGPFPQSKVEKLATHLNSDHEWARIGCLELIACRNAICHSRGIWNDKSIRIIQQFCHTPPKEGEILILGFKHLFHFRKAIRTFLNEVKQ